ncbi:hypothetical protein L195_g061161 [Trifolium pratense]|uniref:Uncharacterized protein n=1 Tax=Trifolium pratense TaxID=57577 RepID=A0A2K3K851_TRIPR|nr:hypothetical protein L195_g061161 [Trifolium pratense]
MSLSWCIAASSSYAGARARLAWPAIGLGLAWPIN